MFVLNLTEFLQLKMSSGLAYTCYQTNSTYYLLLYSATGPVFQCAVDVESAQSQGFTP